MVAKWYNSNAALAAGMVGISSEDIRKFSRGVVSRIYDEKEGEETQENSLEDPAIFGLLENQELWMGHIELPQPVANIQYLRGTNPILPARLGMERKEIERILYGGVYVAAEDTPEFSFGQVIPFKDATELKHKDKLLHGAAALRMLLEKKNVPEREYMVLDTLPVVPICMRYHPLNRDKKDGAWAPYPLNWLYERVILRSDRVKRLTELNAPEIILINEAIQLQEYVDTLISNGSRGFAVSGYLGAPAESLSELHEVITRTDRKPVETPELPAGYTAAGSRAYEIVREGQALHEKEREELTEEQEKELELKGEELLSELYGILAPFFRSVIQDCFGEYQDFHEEMMRVAESAVEDAFDDVDLEKNLEEQLLYGVYRQLLFFVKKQARFA